MRSFNMSTRIAVAAAAIFAIAGGAALTQTDDLSPASGTVHGVADERDSVRPMGVRMNGITGRPLAIRQGVITSQP